MPGQSRADHKEPSPTVLVTGASGGIGRALCRAFARCGSWIGVHYWQKRDEAVRTLEAIREAGSDGALYQADIRSLETVQAMVDHVIRDRQTLNVLISNAGTAGGHLVVRHPESEWTRIIETNLTGNFHCLKTAAEAMRDRGGGSIVVIGSYAGSQGGVGQSAYAASKAGLTGLIKSAAREWAPYNIRVNLVYPGWKATRLAEGAIPDPGTFDDHLLGHPSDLDEVASTICWLAQTKDISGQIWNLDSRIL